MACVSMGIPPCSIGSIRTQIPSASLSLLKSSQIQSSVSIKAASSPSALLHCSFLPSSSLSLSSSSSFSVTGLSLGLDLDSTGIRTSRRRGLQIRAGKPALCLTKRNRSRKSLARTHGFRLRMRTTGGRAILKRRRAKGRRILCTKTNHNTGKRS